MSSILYNNNISEKSFIKSLENQVKSYLGLDYAELFIIFVLNLTLWPCFSVCFVRNIFKGWILYSERNLSYGASYREAWTLYFMGIFQNWLSDTIWLKSVGIGEFSWPTIAQNKTNTANAQGSQWALHLFSYYSTWKHQAV